MSVLSNGVEEQSKRRPELSGNVLSAAEGELDQEGWSIL